MTPCQVELVPFFFYIFTKRYYDLAPSSIVSFLLSILLLDIAYGGLFRNVLPLLPEVFAANSLYSAYVSSSCPPLPLFSCGMISIFFFPGLPPKFVKFPLFVSFFQFPFPTPRIWLSQGGFFFSPAYRPAFLPFNCCGTLPSPFLRPPR